MHDLKPVHAPPCEETGYAKTGQSVSCKVRTSVLVYRTDVRAHTWVGDPRVNIQNRGGMVSPYQARQMMAAVERMVNDGYQGR